MASNKTSHTSGWTLRDSLAAVVLFVASAAVVLWQNAHLAVLWDVSYLLDTAYRITLGQMPYRDFPFAHAPLTFFVQAAVIRLTDRVLFHHTLYAAAVAGMGSVLTWRIALHTLRLRVTSAWTTALLLAVPLSVLGIYGIYPHPEYDCDCVFAILVAMYLLQRLTRPSAQTTLLALASGAAMVVPVFFKQNIGLPFFAAAFLGIVLLLLVQWLTPGTVNAVDARVLRTVLTGATVGALAAVWIVHSLFGIHNYIYWTITFATRRRMPGTAIMLGVYAEPALYWMLPCVVVGALLVFYPRCARFRGTTPLAFLFFATPIAGTMFLFFRAGDPDDRASILLALWPLVLLVSIAVALHTFFRHPSLTTLFPFLLLAAVHGTLLSQQLWGSTYALWPVFVLLLAQLLAEHRWPRTFTPGLALLACVVLTVCGAFYLVSEDRLSYIHLDGTVAHSRVPQLAGLATPGPYLPALDQLVAFATTDIPVNDGVVLLNGEDLFFYATGRAPQFPITLFDPATDPYSPTQVVDEARAHTIRWLVVKRNLQITEDPMPDRDETISMLLKDFVPYRTLDGYDIYRRR